MIAGASALSRGFGEFAEPAQEAAFLKDARPRLAHQLSLIAAVQGALYLAAISYNWEEFGPGFQFWILTLMRLGVGTLLLTASYLARSSRRLELAQWLYFAGGILVMVNQVTEYHFFAQMTGVFNIGKTPFILMIILMTYVVAPVPMWMTIASMLPGSLLFFGYQWAVSGPGAFVTHVAFIYLLLANGVGYACRIVWNRVTRRDYGLRLALEREVGERQCAEQEARRADAAKSRFLAVMSHEIRTPLNGVLGAVQLLQETALLPEQRQFLEVLGRSGNQLALLLDDVLDLARIEAGRLDLARDSFSPAELLASVHAVLYPQARSKGLTLRLDHPPDLPPALEGDVLRLQQVLINLAGNAVKFTERGEVVITLELAEVPEHPELRYCGFTVRDTGPGLDEAAKVRIFAPFEQADMSIRRRHGGAGLGLAISRELVAAMGGELTVESVEGQGSIFRFTLVLPLGEARAAAEAHPGSALSILVVDDLEANLIVAKGLLVSLGHRVRTATTGVQALEILQAERFDAVLLDLHMQDMDGLEVFQRLRQLPAPVRADLPVFLVTADTERSRVQACLAAGMQGLLAKPIRKAKLAALLLGVPAKEVPLVDAAQVRAILTDLGPTVWQAGVEACRTSAEACQEELKDPGRAREALHRLAGLSASYGLARLYQHVRQAESLVAAGAPCPLEETQVLVLTSLQHLEAVSLQSAEIV